MDEPINESTIQFMLSEFRVLEGARGEVLKIISNSVNMYLAVISGALVASSIISSNDMHGVVNVNSVFLGILLILFFLGLATFIRVIEGQISSCMYLRGMNRIRSYFLQSKKKSIFQDYFILPLHDDVPKMGGLGSNNSKFIILFNLAGVMAFFNSVVLGLIAYILADKTFLSNRWIYIFSFSLLIVSFVCFIAYQQNRNNRAEIQPVPKFPNPID